MLRSSILLLIGFLVISSCNSENKEEKKEFGLRDKADYQKAKEEKITTVNTNIDLIIGTWKIDSTAEDGDINVRQIESFQAFVFKQDYILAFLKKNGNASFEDIVGKYEYNGDTLSFYLTKQDGITCYVVKKISQENLVLVGVNSISKGNSKKPTFYLSKYFKKSNTAIFGPSK